MNRAGKELEDAGRLARLGAERGAPTAAAVVCFAGGHRASVVMAIGDEPGTQLAELAVFVAACHPAAAAIATTGRLRGPGGDVLARVAAGSAIDVSGGGNRMDGATWREDGVACSVPVDSVPTSSLLFDAVVRTRVDLHPYLVAEVLAGRGHVVAVQDGVGMGPHPLVQAPTGSGSGTGQGSVRVRVDAIAGELATRHRPAGTALERRSVPGIPYDLPAGWEPACAI